jgi:hypothetical protein
MPDPTVPGYKAFKIISVKEISIPIPGEWSHEELLEFYKTQAELTAILLDLETNDENSKKGRLVISDEIAGVLRQAFVGELKSLYSTYGSPWVDADFVDANGRAVIAFGDFDVWSPWATHFYSVLSQERNSEGMQKWDTARESIRGLKDAWAVKIVTLRKERSNLNYKRVNLEKSIRSQEQENELRLARAELAQWRLFAKEVEFVCATESKGSRTMVDENLPLP